MRAPYETKEAIYAYCIYAVICHQVSLGENMFIHLYKSIKHIAFTLLIIL